MLFLFVKFCFAHCAEWMNSCLWRRTFAKMYLKYLWIALWSDLITSIVLKWQNVSHICCFYHTPQPDSFINKYTTWKPRPHGATEYCPAGGAVTWELPSIIPNKLSFVKWQTLIELQRNSIGISSEIWGEGEQGNRKLDGQFVI